MRLPADTPSRPRLLDLYCCAGGAATGYRRAGFDVTGVDIAPQPHYPYPFLQADVLTLDPTWIAGFDAVHASPPCQRYTRLRHRYACNRHPDLIAPTRALLHAAGRPYVIENVEDAKHLLHDPVMLCGLMFPGLRVFRHRYFETSGFTLNPPAHRSHRGMRCHTLDKRKAHYGSTNEWRDFVMVNGGGNSTVAAAADAMGMTGRELTKQELNEAIPPAYTHHIGQALRARLNVRGEAA
ncbi:DNA cytosine methyltransferase [Nonomuraea fuscirosea]|uniref:DNA cytosine methyltransferase n=1 Tax=Nonomuraea fuscirosea TaxID=1291556 RepID=UPI0034181D76